jgi:L-fuconolactonase
MFRPARHHRLKVLRKATDEEGQVSSGNETFVDSHVHFWELSRFEYQWLETETVLRRDFLPDQLLDDAAQVDGLELSAAVFVQADCRADQGAEEVAWVHELARAGAPVLAVVAHAALERGAACADELSELAAMPLVSGVRRLIQDEPPGFMTSQTFVEGVRQLAKRGLSMDLCVRQHQLDEVIGLVEACPHVLFVVDHLGKPVVSDVEFAPWSGSLARLAEFPNVRCKLSGLASEAPENARTFSALRPWVEHALDVFGPDRCMVGSDWPVVTAATTYGWWFEFVLDVIGELSAGDRTQVLSTTAQDTYDPINRAARAKDPLTWL